MKSLRVRGIPADVLHRFAIDCLEHCLQPEYYMRSELQPPVVRALAAKRGWLAGRIDVSDLQRIAVRAAGACHGNSRWRREGLAGAVEHTIIALALTAPRACAARTADGAQHTMGQRVWAFQGGAGREAAEYGCSAKWGELEWQRAHLGELVAHRRERP